jgi:hypothetical protein
MVDGDNDLLIGKPVPLLVELTPAGPAFDVVEAENEPTGFHDSSQAQIPIPEKIENQAKIPIQPSGTPQSPITYLRTIRDVSIVYLSSGIFNTNFDVATEAIHHANELLHLPSARIRNEVLRAMDWDKIAERIGVVVARRLGGHLNAIQDTIELHLITFRAHPLPADQTWLNALFANASTMIELNTHLGSTDRSLRSAAVGRVGPLVGDWAVARTQRAVRRSRPTWSEQQIRDAASHGFGEVLLWLQVLPLPPNLSLGDLLDLVGPTGFNPPGDSLGVRPSVSKGDLDGNGHRVEPYYPKFAEIVERRKARTLTPRQEKVNQARKNRPARMAVDPLNAAAILLLRTAGDTIFLGGKPGSADDNLDIRIGRLLMTEYEVRALALGSPEIPSLVIGRLQDLFVRELNLPVYRQQLEPSLYACRGGVTEDEAVHRAGPGIPAVVVRRVHKWLHAFGQRDLVMVISTELGVPLVDVKLSLRRIRTRLRNRLGPSLKQARSDTDKKDAVPDEDK